MVQGALFTRDYLSEAITASEAWRALHNDAVTAFRDAILEIFRAFPTAGRPNEAATEDDLIWRVLERLGWRHWSRQLNLSPKGMEHKPDGLLFLD